MKKTVLALAAASVLAVSVQAALAQDKPAAPPPRLAAGQAARAGRIEARAASRAR